MTVAQGGGVGAGLARVAAAAPEVGGAVRRGGWWRAVVVVGVVVSALVFWDGARRTPTPPASGAGLRGAVAGAVGPGVASRGVLRFGTFNICSGKGLDGRKDLGRDARVLRGCDVVGLNEVRGPGMLGGPDQAEVLGRALGVQWLFAASERQRWHESFGNAVLSDVPATHWQRFPVSQPWANGNRTVLLVKVVWGGKVVNVMITHLDKSADRGPELAMVSELFRALEGPAVLMADLNTFPNDPRMGLLLRESPGVVDVLDRPGIGQRERRDWIVVKGMRCTGAGSFDDGTSDHPFYWADLAVGGE